MKLSFFYRLKTPSYLFEFCQEIVLSKNVIISCIQKKHGMLEISALVSIIQELLHHYSFLMH